MQTAPPIGLEFDQAVPLWKNIAPLDGIVSPVGQDFLSRLRKGVVISCISGENPRGRRRCHKLKEDATLRLSAGSDGQWYLMAEAPLSNGGNLSIRLNHIPIWGTSIFRETDSELIAIPHGGGSLDIVKKEGSFWFGKMRAATRAWLNQHDLCH